MAQKCCFADNDDEEEEEEEEEEEVRVWSTFISVCLSLSLSGMRHKLLWIW
jgi:hypothetical protein